MKKEEIAKIVEDLVSIAKVAMPPSLFLEDPRVKKAKALLVSLGRPSSPARPPNVDIDTELEALVGPILDIPGVAQRERVPRSWTEGLVLAPATLSVRSEGLRPHQST